MDIFNQAHDKVSVPENRLDVKKALLIWFLEMVDILTNPNKSSILSLYIGIIPLRFWGYARAKSGRRSDC